MNVIRLHTPASVRLLRTAGRIARLACLRWRLSDREAIGQLLAADPFHPSDQVAQYLADTEALRAEIHQLEKQ